MDCTFYDGGMSSAVADPAHLDRLSCLLNRRTHGLLAGSIDTLRDMGRWVAHQRPSRLVPPAGKDLKGEKRKARRVVDFSAYADWPYCEHCGHFSELAASLVALGHIPATELPPGSPRFCADHNPATNPAVARRRARFEQVLDAIAQELSSDTAFRMQFTQCAWAHSRTTELHQNEVMAFAAKAAHATLIADPVETYIRECAFQIARNPIDDTGLAIAKMRAEGMSQAAIARRLGLSRQAVSQRIRKTTGHFDFARRSPLLYWWPDKVVLNDPEIKPVPCACRQRNIAIPFQMANERSHDETRDLAGHQA